MQVISVQKQKKRTSLRGRESAFEIVGGGFEGSEPALFGELFFLTKVVEAPIESVPLGYKYPARCSGGGVPRRAQSFREHRNIGPELAAFRGENSMMRRVES